MTACLSRFVAFKCLCLPLMRRCWGFGEPLFSPLISKQEKMSKERARKERVRRRNKGCEGMREDLVFQIQLLRSQGYSAPLPPPTGHVFLSSVAVIRKGRSKGLAECHCSILALRAARVWPRVALWGGS